MGELLSGTFTQREFLNEFVYQRFQPRLLLVTRSFGVAASRFGSKAGMTPSPRDIRFTPR